MTNPYRKSTAEDHELARQERMRREHMPADLQLEARLADLQTFIRQLANTPHGKADLARRVQLFGDLRRRPAKVSATITASCANGWTASAKHRTFS